MKLFAVTASPIGIPHTYMATKNLQKAGDVLGVENELTAKEIEEAYRIIIARCKEIKIDRFVEKSCWSPVWCNPENLISRMKSDEVSVSKVVCEKYRQMFTLPFEGIFMRLKHEVISILWLYLYEFLFVKI